MRSSQIVIDGVHCFLGLLIHFWSRSDAAYVAHRRGPVHVLRVLHDAHGADSAGQGVPDALHLDLFLALLLLFDFGGLLRLALPLVKDFIDNLTTIEQFFEVSGTLRQTSGRLLRLPSLQGRNEPIIRNGLLVDFNGGAAALILVELPLLFTDCP